VPIASFNLSMNQIQFSLVSESITPIATGYIQLWASTAHATHNCPLNLPVKKVGLVWVAETWMAGLLWVPEI
jgi:hypothetical protein